MGETLNAWSRNVPTKRTGGVIFIRNCDVLSPLPQEKDNRLRAVLACDPKRCGTPIILVTLRLRSWRSPVTLETV
jgi:hypothetical protein